MDHGLDAVPPTLPAQLLLLVAGVLVFFLLSAGVAAALPLAWFGKSWAIAGLAATGLGILLSHRDHQPPSPRLLYTLYHALAVVAGFALVETFWPRVGWGKAFGIAMLFMAGGMIGMLHNLVWQRTRALRP